jgi:asparagine synthase (glutamine-hydrolysing)
MCGVAGYIGTRRIEDEAAARCQELMARRGPDGQGVYRHELNGRHVLLVHTRLAIIDLDERANQPFVQSGCALCFNGELYNYIEVRDRLKRQGQSFATTSDTEVLHQSLVSVGESVLDECEGMWAFVFYQESDGSLMLCRDRFGEKPLYLYENADGLYFASTPKALFALLGKNLPVNTTQVMRFLVNGYKFLYKSGETFFEGLRELPAGKLLRRDNQGEGAERAYWTFRSGSEDDSLTFDESAALVREKLLRSLELRLRSDVPLAFCMSGGVDSNSLISAAKRVFDYDVHGFTVVNTDARYEEQSLVKTVVRELGVRHTAVPLSTENFLSNMRRLVSAHDAPVYTISYYVHWLLMERIKQYGYKISLSGTAADELFSGYYDHHLLYLASITEDSELLKRSKTNFREHVAPIVRNPYLQDPERFVRNPDFRDHITLGAQEFSDRLTEPFQESFSEREYSGRLLRKRMLNELFEEVIPVILHEDDANAMDHSIENRSPFLDRRVFEDSLRIPTRHLVQEGKAKAVLRESMRGIVPDAILDCRRKVGFNAPILDLLDTSDSAVIDTLLADSPIFELVKRSSIEQLLSQSALPNKESKFLFSFLGCKFFLEEFAG